MSDAEKSALDRRLNVQDVQVGPLGQVLMELQDNVRAITETLDGEVAHLRGNGWTDSQARFIVATTLGWRPPDGEQQEGDPDGTR